MGRVGSRSRWMNSHLERYASSILKLRDSNSVRALQSGCAIFIVPMPHAKEDVVYYWLICRKCRMWQTGSPMPSGGIQGFIWATSPKIPEFFISSFEELTQKTFDPFREGVTLKIAATYGEACPVRSLRGLFFPSTCISGCTTVFPGLKTLFQRPPRRHPTRPARRVWDTRQLLQPLLPQGGARYRRTKSWVEYEAYQETGQMEIKTRTNHILTLPMIPSSMPQDVINSPRASSWPSVSRLGRPSTPFFGALGFSLALGFARCRSRATLAGTSTAGCPSTARYSSGPESG